PVLVDVRIDAGHAVGPAFERPQDGVQERALPLDHPEEKAPERSHADEDEHDEARDLQEAVGRHRISPGRSEALRTQQRVDEVDEEAGGHDAADQVLEAHSQSLSLANVSAAKAAKHASVIPTNRRSAIGSSPAAR